MIAKRELKHDPYRCEEAVFCRKVLNWSVLIMIVQIIPCCPIGCLFLVFYASHFLLRLRVVVGLAFVNVVCRIYPLISSMAVERLSLRCKTVLFTN